LKNNRKIDKKTISRAFKSMISISLRILMKNLSHRRFKRSKKARGRLIKVNKKNKPKKFR
jgi:hypothetical protein